jgi:asparagine synthetase B (glutamine-hydrolysing)
MADILIVFGETHWVETQLIGSEPSNVDVFEFDVSGDRACRIAMRGGPSPWSGGGRPLDAGWIGWLGDVRAVDGVADAEVRAHPTDVVASTWRRHGDEGLARLHGRVAAVRFECDPPRLHVARDKLGTIPLAFWRGTSGVVVSSDSDWMLDVRDAPRRPNPERIRWFLTWGEDDGRDDVYEGLERLRPGEVATWGLETAPRVRRYWSPDTTPLPDSPGLRTRYLECFDRVMDDVARSEPVVSMSGGIDSVLIAAALAARSSDPIDVVSQIAPSMPIVDESEAIRDVASVLPIRVHPYDVSDGTPLRDEAVLTRDYGTGPVHHGGERADVAMRRWMVEQLDRRRIALGTGAEMLLEHPRNVSRSSAVRSGRLQAWHRIVERDGFGMFVRQLGRVGLEAMGGFEEVRDLYRRLRTWWSGDDERIPSWWDAERWVRGKEERESRERRAEATFGARKLDVVDGWRWECICRGRERQARRSGTTSFEPYLDDRLWELALRLPPSVTIDEWILRACARAYLPEQLAMRSNTQSFNPLIESGLSTRGARWVASEFSPSHLEAAGLVRDEAFCELYERYVDCVRHKEARGRRIVQHGLLWNTLSAEIWWRGLEDDGSRRPPESR